MQDYVSNVISDKHKLHMGDDLIKTHFTKTEIMDFYSKDLAFWLDEQKYNADRLKEDKNQENICQEYCITKGMEQVKGEIEEQFDDEVKKLIFDKTVIKMKTKKIIEDPNIKM